MTNAKQDPLQQLAEHLAANHHLNCDPVSYVYREGQDYDVWGVNCYDAKIPFRVRVHSIENGYVNYSESGQMGGRIYGALRIDSKALAEDAFARIERSNAAQDVYARKVG